MHVSVLGTGYLGATHAACLAALGHRVHGVDVDPARIELLASGRAPFHEPRLDALLRDGVASGMLSFGVDLSAVAEADVHFICVGTPQCAGGSGQADLSSLWQLAHELAAELHRDCLVVGKSTVPVGTAARLRQLLQRFAPAGAGVEVAWNPEFLREGHAVADSLRPDRLVLGVDTDTADQLLRDLYRPLLTAGVPVVRTDPATAELAKVSANVMLASRLSLVNVLAEVCEAAGADVSDLVTILGHDPRIGSSFLVPGLGYGGGCLPKDTRAFVARARELGVGGPARLLEQVDTVNRHQRTRTVDLAVHMLGGEIRGAAVTVLGAAFKAGSDDVRDSPALDVAATLHRRGADVVVYDPRACDGARRVHPELRYATDAVSACQGSELLLVLTEWEEFRGLDPVSLAQTVAVARVLDGRLVLDPAKWEQAGWQLCALGRTSGEGRS
ncbi:MAG: UDP-glucose/GDP-mannose dehydrogenase family protein [Nocardioidaceae bacterium]|nr:UDP-glucose/GDP-mannose dehydrogenase family protein [Nocardioidaceae bacterium]